MESVRTILRTKGSDVWCVSPDASVFEALELMSQKNIGAVLVADGGKPEGIFSERDYARCIVLEGKVSRRTPVREVMSPHVSYVAPDDSVAECMALMTDKHLRHLPVIEKDELLGLISIGDVVKAVISRQETKIRELKNTITGYDHFLKF